MKLSILLLLFFVFSVNGFSQTGNNPIIELGVDCTELAEFPGGNTAFVKFINDNLFYDPSSQLCQAYGKIYVSFEVDTNGQVMNPIIKKGLNNEADKAVINAFRKMPLWIPGKECGKVVKQKLVFPVRIAPK